VPCHFRAGKQFGGLRWLAISYRAADLSKIPTPAVKIPFIDRSVN
jgi:hypothetical protein